ncbi:MAG: glutamate synthase subunit beta [Gammaproteobacteria bacterium]|nr:glutamate synthase subunit beta [Gammaproteobacteria bacterium]
MGATNGFLRHTRIAAPYRDPLKRLDDYQEIYTPHDARGLAVQGSRCMDCGVPFCQSGTKSTHRIDRGGCPIHNRIPDWNDLVYRGHWRDALYSLHATNNFPEFTGRVCPAPCEGSCVLGITDPPVTIKNIEMAIVDYGFEKGWIVPEPPDSRTDRQIAVVGSGPAGLAAAAQLNRAGHLVRVFEREDRVGGLLTYGIPNMKLDKTMVVDRRINLLREEGIEFHVNSDVADGNSGTVSIGALAEEYDAVLLATGATAPNDLNVPGRELNGIHFAMDYLTASTKRLLDPSCDKAKFLDAKNRDVLVIGGGDTGTDCIATAVRQGCKSLVNFELFPAHPNQRSESNPWPEYPQVFRVDYGHEEVQARFGADPRVFSISTTSFLGDDNGTVQAVATVDVNLKDGKIGELQNTRREWEFDLVLLALGFRGPEHYIAEPLGLNFDSRSNYLATKGIYQTNVTNVFAAGDCRRGQSLVVNAINEGREAAQQIDLRLMGRTALSG